MLAFDSFNDEGIENFRFFEFSFLKFSIFCFKKWFYHQTADWIIVRTLDFLNANSPFSVRGFGTQNISKEKYDGQNGKNGQNSVGTGQLWSEIEAEVPSK